MKALQYINAFFSVGFILFYLIYGIARPYKITEEELKQLRDVD